MPVSTSGPAPSSIAAVVDDTVDGAFHRLATRAAGHGEEVTRLARAAHRAGAGGKRFRPRLVLSAFHAFGAGRPWTRAVLDVAAGFELLHTAFVIHDDVIDGDVERRGRPNVAGTFAREAAASGCGTEPAARLGAAAAILAGDLLLHEATRIIALADVPPVQRARLLDLVDEAILVTASGEFADVAHSVLPGVPAAGDVLAATRDKTAVYSFSAPLQAGALLAGVDDATLDALEAEGRALGLAFQLVDDLIGAFGTAEQAGRAPGADLREHRHTALMALALDTEMWPRVRSTAALADTGPVALRAAQDALEESGARREASALIEETLRDSRARAVAAALPRAAQDMLTDLATSISERIP